MNVKIRPAAFWILFFVIFGPGREWSYAADSSGLRKVRMAFTSLSAVMMPPWLAREAGIFNKHGLEVEVIATPTGVEGMNASDRRRSAVFADIRRHDCKRGVGRGRRNDRGHHARYTCPASDGPPGN